MEKFETVVYLLILKALAIKVDEHIAGQEKFTPFLIEL